MDTNSKIFAFGLDAYDSVGKFDHFCYLQVLYPETVHLLIIIFAYVY